MSLTQEKLYRQLCEFLALEGIIKYSFPDYVWRSKDKTKELTLPLVVMEQICREILLSWETHPTIKDISQLSADDRDSIRGYVDKRVLDYYGPDTVGVR